MSLGRVITYRDLFFYILVLYVRLQSDFGVQSQYNREQLINASFVLQLFKVRREIWKVYFQDTSYAICI